jgi:hypothetical protein
MLRKDCGVSASIVREVARRVTAAEAQEKAIIRRRLA